MKFSAIALAALALIAAAPLASAQTDAAPTATVAKANFSEPQLQSFANAYRSIVALSQEYLPKLKAAADAKEAEAINQEAQGKMVAAIKQAGLTKEKYQEIAASLRDNPALVEKINGMLQEKPKQQ